jgi:H+/gluconate symporter-like permease
VLRHLHAAAQGTEQRALGQVVVAEEHGIDGGPLILSHVNDAGFWLVKQYFNMTVVETFKTWTAMETLISVVAIVLIMALSTVI